MKLRKFIPILIMMTLVFSCNFSVKKEEAKRNPNDERGSSYLDSNRKSETQTVDPYDSLLMAKIDTSSLEGKRKYIMNHFLYENAPSAAEYDTLFDLNYDGEKDYVIGYYGQAGTGLKNGVMVYLYEKNKNTYCFNEQLSALRNPTFYIKRKFITSFYIAHGAGDGNKLEWINEKWVITKEFSVSNEGEKSVWTIIYPLKNKKEEQIRPYIMIPPTDIIESQYSGDI